MYVYVYIYIERYSHTCKHANIYPLLTESCEPPPMKEGANPKVDGSTRSWSQMFCCQGCWWCSWASFTCLCTLHMHNVLYRWCIFVCIYVCAYIYIYTYIYIYIYIYIPVSAPLGIWSLRRVRRWWRRRVRRWAPQHDGGAPRFQERIQKGEIWEGWALTYGRNGSSERKKTPRKKNSKVRYGKNDLWHMGEMGRVRE